MSASSCIEFEQLHEQLNMCWSFFQDTLNIPENGRGANALDLFGLSPGFSLEEVAEKLLVATESIRKSQRSFPKQTQAARSTLERAASVLKDAQKARAYQAWLAERRGSGSGKASAGSAQKFDNQQQHSDTKQYQQAAYKAQHEDEARTKREAEERAAAERRWKEAQEKKRATTWDRDTALQKPDWMFAMPAYASISLAALQLLPAYRDTTGGIMAAIMAVGVGVGGLIINWVRTASTSMRNKQLAGWAIGIVVMSRLLFPTGGVPGNPRASNHAKADSGINSRNKIVKHNVQPPPKGRPSRKARPSTPAAPPVVRSTTRTEKIPYETIRKKTGDLAVGERRVEQHGVLGAKRVTLEVTSVNGKPISRRVVSKEVIKSPVPQVILVGTKRNEPSSPHAQFCTNCGARREPGSKFCTKCGHPF